ncbi:MAG: HAMP domain-containing sensor histidine kinase, partial [Halobacteria archaeon]|nr:HAMP domain-containing sensor histidine kinase [Halobacteria archaeon]
IQGYTEIAEETGEPEHFDEIRDACDRMDNMISDVLTLARDGQSVDETESLELDSVTEEAWGNVDTADAELENEARAIVEGDERRLLRLLENLFRNSVEHNDDTVTVRVGVFEDGFYVEDDGEGIPEDKMEYVLEQGYTTSDEGTGLGLSIVKGIVEAHDWELSVGESDEGGARFEIKNVRHRVREPKKV